MENFYKQLNDIVSVLKTFDHIAIIGKGRGILDIPKNALQKAFVINVNDAERYVPGHVTIFHASWILDSLKEHGLKNSFYISSQPMDELIQKDQKYIYAPFEPQNNEGAEHIAAEFQQKDFVISDFLLITAIHLAYILNQQLDRPKKIYLLGFDFQYDDRSEVLDLSGHEVDYKKILLKTQKENFRFVRSYLQDVLNIDLIHVGNSDLSDIHISEFADLFLEKTIYSGKSNFDNTRAYQKLLQKCDQDHYTLVVAELTNNHIGDADRLVNMIRIAKKNGADMIKVQKRHVDTFYTEQELATYYKSPFGNTLGDYRRGVELDENLMQVLVEECAASEIVWFASVLDYASLQFLAPYNPPVIKLPSTISNHRNFLKKVAEEYSGDLVISTGFTDLHYEEFVLDTFSGDRRIFLLQCTSSYPAPPEACQIAVVRHYEELRTVGHRVNLYSGYSSHDLGSLGSMMAVAAGASMVEKHVKYGNLEWIHFDGVALDLTTAEFETYVKDIRKAQLMCGSKMKQIHQAEHHKYKPNEQHN
ncbi:MAG: N-acetylneuraminate synthase family protein [Chitinophagaceae bacterium]|nr:N-acetylneuraminate synthase family protein [Chitinophagaceae bacterium]